MKRMARVLSLGLLLSISTVAMAGKGNDRNGHDGYYDNSDRQHHNARYDERYNGHRKDRYDRRHYAKHYRHGNRHYVKNKRYARRHSHHGYYCYDWHPRGYVAPRRHYRYGGPEFMIVYQPRTGLYIDGGH
jgi:Ni/Co efflux regulator RcnB